MGKILLELNWSDIFSFFSEFFNMAYIGSSKGLCLAISAPNRKVLKNRIFQREKVAKFANKNLIIICNFSLQIRKKIFCHTQHIFISKNLARQLLIWNLQSQIWITLSLLLLLINHPSNFVVGQSDPEGLSAVGVETARVGCQISGLGDAISGMSKPNEHDKLRCENCEIATLFSQHFESASCPTPNDSLPPCGIRRSWPTDAFGGFFLLILSCATLVQNSQDFLARWNLRMWNYLCKFARKISSYQFLLTNPANFLL